MDSLSDRPAVEQGHALQIVVGALKIPLYPPATKFIQERIRLCAQPLPPGIENLRQWLAALSPQHFEAAFIEANNPLEIDNPDLGLVGFGPMGGANAAYGGALVDQREAEPRYLRYFRKEGYEGEEAVFMARFLNNLLEHMGEPERSEFEVSIIGPGSLEYRRRRWVKFLSANPPAWLLAHMARYAQEQRQA